MIVRRDHDGKYKTGSDWNQKAGRFFNEQGKTHFN